jgi:hypothetical protein
MRHDRNTSTRGDAGRALASAVILPVVSAVIIVIVRSRAPRLGRLADTCVGRPITPPGDRGACGTFRRVSRAGDA